MINYNNRVFRSVSNTENGEVSNQTMFYYSQKDNIVEAKYHGGSVVQGSLIAIVDQHGQLDMRYHHVNINGEIMTGKCYSTPELMSEGRIRLHEKWEWTSGDFSKGESVIEEVNGVEER